ncbi:hypothetical protein PMI08_03016 [Brevibacillus sp. CF112]|nr:hypothetical protein PMI08_03016 [Brevibacillus sp. CF112]
MGTNKPLAVSQRTIMTPDPVEAEPSVLRAMSLQLYSESVRAMLLQEFQIEIASSFGLLKGKIWRIETIGYSCRKQNILHLLGALEAVLIRHGARVHAGRVVQAALDVYLS